MKYITYIKIYNIILFRTMTHIHNIYIDIDIGNAQYQM